MCSLSGLQVSDTLCAGGHKQRLRLMRAAVGVLLLLDVGQYARRGDETQPFRKTGT